MSPAPVRDFYESNHFSDRVEASHGIEPDFTGFDEIAAELGNGDMLEVGCGTGHLLAAARARGREVLGTDISAYNRRYAEEHWGIEVYNDIPPRQFDNIVSLNVIEHIADPLSHFIAIRKALKPGARYFLSTANADCLIASVCGPWWAMFKPEDHVSIPSAKSLSLLGARAQLNLCRVWCSEYPLETPVGIAIAIRDRFAQRIAETGDLPDVAIAGKAQRLRALRAFSFVGNALARLMIANCIKAVFEAC